MYVQNLLFGERRRWRRRRILSDWFWKSIAGGMINIKRLFLIAGVLQNMKRSQHILAINTVHSKKWLHCRYSLINVISYLDEKYSVKQGFFDVCIYIFLRENCPRKKIFDQMFWLRWCLKLTTSFVNLTAYRENFPFDESLNVFELGLSLTSWVYYFKFVLTRKQARNKEWKGKEKEEHHRNSKTRSKLMINDHIYIYIYSIHFH